MKKIIFIILFSLFFLFLFLISSTYKISANGGGKGKLVESGVFCDDNGNPTNDPTGKIYTAIGCIPVENTQEFVKFLLTWGLGVAGGVALLLIIVAGYMIMTSSGDMGKLKAGQELLTAALMGLALLLFGAFFLRLIGVEILQIPGFGS